MGDTVVFIKKKNIDNSKAFDFGRTSGDYAKYRDIYPSEFYEKIVERGLCVNGQKVLDLGTGTGVLPRNMYKYGADWTGTDLSENQIMWARWLCRENNMNIKFITTSAEEIDFPENSFDVVTACQCFFYFDHKKLAPILRRILRPGGKLLVLYMAWLPFEDEIAGKSEQLVLKFNGDWSGAGERMHPIEIPDCYNEMFEISYSFEYPLKVHFSRESWNGRMKSCRGIGASLSKNQIEAWEREHIKMLTEIAPEEFDILHYAAMCELTVIK